MLNGVAVFVNIPTLPREPEALTPEGMPTLVMTVTLPIDPLAETDSV
jgi:hypothetical protein